MARAETSLPHTHRLDSTASFAPSGPVPLGDHTTRDSIVKPRVLHIAGVVNEGVASFLSPALMALRDSGHDQTVILLDHPRYHHLIKQIPDSVRVCAIPVAQGLFPQHWGAVRELAAQLLQEQRFTAVHVHGFLPWALGLSFGRKLPPAVRVLYTPHGSRSLAWVQRLHALSRAMMPRSTARRQAVIAAPQREVVPLSLAQAHDVVEVDAALDDRLFARPRSEHATPVLMSGDWHRSTDGLEQFCQMAVMLSAQELELRFHWVGYLSNYAKARLHASNVQAHAISGEHSTPWELLAQAWCHLAPNAPHGFPLVTASAMALGLPVVALDCPAHRGFITHGHNGLLYKNPDEALLMVSRLLDDKALRHKLGQAARETASKRWSRQAQQKALAHTYRQR